MTAYELPPEPDQDTVWTIELGLGASDEPNPVRWTHDPATGVWSRDDGRWCPSWYALLKGRRVFTTHPDLDGLPPLPWTWDDVYGMRDADGRTLALDDEVRCLIVRAVNAHAERLLVADQSRADQEVPR